MDFDGLDTPCALVDTAAMDRNIARMQARMDGLGVALRPHVKTSKCIPVIRAQMAAGARGVTVSTLREAEECFRSGITDIMYAVGMAGSRLHRALDLIRAGCGLTLVVDNVDSAEAIAAFGRANHAVFDVLLEIDTDGHRSGIEPEDGLLLRVASRLAGDGARIAGVMTHAGASYSLSDPEYLARMAEQERSGCVRAAGRLRAAGYPCPIVSVGSTPTALSALSLEGVTEVRAGVYVFHDLVMTEVGVCEVSDIALSVLATVIGHQSAKGWAIIDAGWMAMSRDRGTAGRAHDYGYGQVCTQDGAPIPGCVVEDANQEHGIVGFQDGRTADIARLFPVGTRLRILPNHACATAAQFPEYHAFSPDGRIETWPRFYGW